MTDEEFEALWKKSKDCDRKRKHLPGKSRYDEGFLERISDYPFDD